MQQFELTLKNEKLRQYHRIALFFILINLSLFVYIALSAGNRAMRITAISGAIFTIIALAIDYFLTSIKNNADAPYKLVAIYALSMAWWKMGFWWAGVIVILLGTLYLISKKPWLVRIGKDGIIYPSFPKKKINWPSLNYIILKDGLLTIDLKNNKVIQQPVDEEKSVVNEQDFNDFCQQQLNTAKS